MVSHLILHYQHCDNLRPHNESSVSELISRNFHLGLQDGDFLVRESQGSPGQYVLTGMQGGVKKHLLLVDPEGVVSI